MIAIWRDQMQYFAMQHAIFQTIFVMQNFCYAYYTLENKSSNTYEYQPVELDDNLIENNREECCYHPKIKLIISGEAMSC